MRKAFAYRRVSTKGQEDGYSPEGQDRVIDETAERFGCKIVADFYESKTAFKWDVRPEFARMCKEFRRRSDVEVILAFKFDRLARNMTETALLLEGLGATMITYIEGEISDDVNMLPGYMYAGLARGESKDTSRRVTLGLETKARNGYWPTYAPTGYVNVRQGRQAWIEPDPVPARIIDELFTLYAHTQMSLKEVAAWARAAGLRSRYGAKMYLGAVHALLQNPLYYGGLPWKGEIYEGKHEPLVSRETWDAVQAKMHGRKGPRRQTRHFPFRDVFTLTCAYCGCQITASAVKGGRYTYYHCSRSKGKCEQPFWPADELSDRLRAVVDRIHVPLPEVRRILREQATTEEERQRTIKAQLIQLKADARRVQELRDDTYLEKLEHIIEPAQWVRIDRELAERGELIESEIARLTEAGQRNPNDVAAVFKLLNRVPVWYNREDDERRAKLLNILASNCRLSADNLVPTYRIPFDAVASAVETGDWLGAVEVVQTHVGLVVPAMELVYTR